MSVLLDGNAVLGEDCEWSGTWYYSKEKTPSYPFRYARTSDTIPSDLLEYVSFFTPPTNKSKKGNNRSRRGSKGRSTSSRRRSRIAISSAAAAASTAAGAVVEAGPLQDPAAAAAEANAALEVDVEEEGGADGDDNGDDDNDNDNEDEDEDQDEGEQDAGADANAAGDNDMNVATEDEMPAAEENQNHADSRMLEETSGVSPAVIQQIASESGLLHSPGPIGTPAVGFKVGQSRPTGLQPVRIPRDHPLFGLWTGSFDVMEAAPGGGQEHTVAETFFLHSFLGNPEQKALTCLPGQSYFTFSALRASPFPLLPLSLMPKPPTKQSPSSADKADKASDADGDTSSTTGAASIEATLGPLEPDGDTAQEVGALIRSNSRGSLQKTAAATTPAPTTAQPPSAVAVLEAEAEAVDPDAVTDGSGTSPLLIMVGFGRNQFGRFSLTASYNRDTNTMLAEKRYMHTKSATTQRKGRRGPDTQELDPMTTRPRPNPIDLGSLSGTGRRKRSSMGAYYNRRGSEDFAYGDDDEFYGMGAASSNHRRSRQSSLGNQAATELPAPEAELDPEDSADYRGACYDESTGEVYEGGWRSHKRHGRGIVLYADGSMYEGQFVNGKEHGPGQLMTSDRKVLYSGEWTDGLMHGHGSYNFFSGDRYVGDWREGNRHGKGEFVTRDGCKYVGDWRENRRSGRGVFTWLDGSCYDGEWDEDSRHGKGHLTLATGFSYEGLWCRNFFDGRGITIFPDGQKYEGTYKAGLREGRGSVTFPEGAVYEGRFRDDRLDGQGTIKVTRSVPGAEDGERMVPIEIQADMRRIHLKAGFGDGGHH